MKIRLSKRICSTPGCARTVHAQDRCTIHYRAWRLYGDFTPATSNAGNAQHRARTAEQALAGIVEATTPQGCWLVEARRVDRSTGYAKLDLHGATWLAHRLAHETHIGPIPAGLQVDHTCHNADPGCRSGICQHRRCINPEHLEAVTLGENLRRAAAGRRLAVSA